MSGPLPCGQYVLYALIDGDNVGPNETLVLLFEHLTNLEASLTSNTYFTHAPANNTLQINQNGAHDGHCFWNTVRSDYRIQLETQVLFAESGKAFNTDTRTVAIETMRHV